MFAMTQDSDSSSMSVKEANRTTLPYLKIWPIIATVGLIMFAFMALVVFIALPAHFIFHGAGRFVRRNWIRLFFRQDEFQDFFQA